MNIDNLLAEIKSNRKLSPYSWHKAMFIGFVEGIGWYVKKN